MQTLGSVIRTRREELGVARKEICRRACLSFKELAEVEDGESWPLAGPLGRLAQRLRLDEAWLVGLVEWEQ